MLIALLQVASATQFVCDLGYEANFGGVVVDGVCILDDEPEGTFADDWGTPERAENQGDWTECQEGGTLVEIVDKDWELGQLFHHRWRYDEQGVLTGECQDGTWGTFACCTDTEAQLVSHWRVGVLETCTPVEEPDQGCDHARSAGSLHALALGGVALLRRRRRAPT